jgi:hypothetical protein
MTRLRDLRFRRFGTVLAGLALCLQLAFASWGMLALAVPDEPADALGGHALYAVRLSRLALSVDEEIPHAGGTLRMEAIYPRCVGLDVHERWLRA